jgi:hypothetical protein
MIENKKIKFAVIIAINVITFSLLWCLSKSSDAEPEYISAKILSLVAVHDNKKDIGKSFNRYIIELKVLSEPRNSLSLEESYIKNKLLRIIVEK